MFSSNESNEEKAEKYVEQLLHSKDKESWIRRITDLDYEIAYRDGGICGPKLGLLVLSKLGKIARKRGHILTLWKAGFNAEAAILLFTP